MALFATAATPMGLWAPPRNRFTKQEDKREIWELDGTVMQLDWLLQDQNLFGFLGELPSDQGLQARWLNPKKMRLSV